MLVVRGDASKVSKSLRPFLRSDSIAANVLRKALEGKGQPCAPWRYLDLARLEWDVLRRYIGTKIIRHNTVESYL
jgi:hypothetical protein